MSFYLCHDLWKFNKCMLLSCLFRKFSRQENHFFLTLLQMTPKSMSKYFQTLKGWINYRIITLDAIRLVFILIFLVNIDVMNMYTNMTKWRLCLKSDGVAVSVNKTMIFTITQSLIIYSHSTVNHQFLISSISNNKKNKAKLVITNLHVYTCI